VQNCLGLIVNAKALIKEYSSLFQETLDNMDEDANEIIKRHYEQGRNGLVSYLNIINMIESLIKNANLKQMSEKLKTLHDKTNDNEKKLYFFENRVKLVNDILTSKIKMLEKERAKALQ
jgi:hypothetical protein